jgi:hypothetical protein
LADKDSTLSNIEDGHMEAETVWGEIADDGLDSGEIVVNNPVAVKRDMSSAERTRRAMSLKLAGASYAQIALNLGYHDASGARKAVQRGMKNALHETSGELKKIHYGRLEHMLMLLWADVNNRDLASMSAALAVMDRMERLYGLNAAEKIDVTTGTNTVILADGDKDSYINALREAGKRLAIDVSSSSPQDEEDDEDDEDTQDSSIDSH